MSGLFVVAGIQSALDPAGHQAAEIHSLWHLFLWVCLAVYIITIAFFIVALIKGRRRVEPVTDPANERRMTIAVSTGSAITIITLLGLLVSDMAAGRTIGTFGANGTSKLEIEVTGHQWWWEVTYPHEQPSKIIKTANEIHIPTGRPILVRVATRDVIHSLWMPNLHGKRDLIPGRVNKFWIEADRPGVFRGQCAEYCGMQHANMALVVVAESPEDFDRWQQHQRTPAPDPHTPELLRGQQAFLSLPCVNCHAITGTDAYATLGPDLTHIASRPTLAAGTLINNKGNLSGWIANAPAIKPGVQMPANVMDAQQMNDVVAYLESLK
jgi:cytochrome c oxidase subunit 2